jgi:hypothetical protein
MLLANEASSEGKTSNVSAKVAEKPAFNSRYDEAVFFLTPIFPVIDCEGAGEIEDSGVDEHFNTLFYYNDRDQSKYIVESEFVRGRNEGSASLSRFVFAMMDSDQNGKVTTLEYRRYISLTIELADLDKNGELQDFELDPSKKLVNTVLGKNIGSNELRQSAHPLATQSDQSSKALDKNHIGHNHE